MSKKKKCPLAVHDWLCRALHASLQICMLPQFLIEIVAVQFAKVTIKNFWSQKHNLKVMYVAP